MEIQKALNTLFEAYRELPKDKRREYARALGVIKAELATEPSVVMFNNKDNWGEYTFK